MDHTDLGLSFISEHSVEEQVPDVRGSIPMVGIFFPVTLQFSIVRLGIIDLRVNDLRRKSKLCFGPPGPAGPRRMICSHEQLWKQLRQKSNTCLVVCRFSVQRGKIYNRDQASLSPSEAVTRALWPAHRASGEAGKELT